MKLLNASFIALGCVLANGLHSQTSETVVKQSSIRAEAASTPAVAESPAQTRIRVAKQQVAISTVKTNAWNDLAIAYLRRARETKDDRYLTDAEQALNAGLVLSKSDFQLQKTEVALLLARHRYAEAKEKATLLNKHTPDDVMTYGYIAEADIALKDLDDAEKSAQWMLNMRPNNIPGLLLGAKLRGLYGDPDGALDFLRIAYSETSPSEVEDLAWIANQMASIEIDAGKPDAAQALLDQAQQLFPNYPYTSENLARMKAAGSSSQPARREQPTSDLSNLGNMTDLQGTSQATATKTSAAGAVPASQALRKRVDQQRFPSFAPVPAKLMMPLPTDTERLVHKAQGLIASNPKEAGGYAELGAAYFQRARETGDVSQYQLSEEALNKSLELVSTDFTADEPLATLAEVCMGEHRFADALNYSLKALSLGSGDVSPFATVGDAYADMGEYDKALKSYARLTPRDMTLSPRAAYARDSRLAYLRFIAGDTQGAVNLMRASVSEGQEAQLPSENLAWLSYELGEFAAQAGDAVAADNAYVTALTVHPGDYRALAALGKLRANHGRYAEAIELYKRAIAVVPMPIFVAELGDLYTKMGNQSEARKQYQLVEYIGLLGHINQVLHNRDLALFYADHDTKLPEALELARKELEVRHDIYTWDALAWALYKNGQYNEASEASRKALQFGTRDSLLLFHAGIIAQHAGKTDDAKALLSEALDTNPDFHLLYSAEAKKQLEQLSTQAMAGASHVR